MQGIRAKVSEAGSVKCSPARWATAATLLKCCLCGQSKSPHASAHRHYAGDQDQITTPSAGIMPDHVGDRGAAHLDPGASRSPTYQADPDIGQQCQLCAGPHRSISFCCRCTQPGAVSPRRTDQADISAPQGCPQGMHPGKSPADLGYVVLSMMRS